MDCLMGSATDTSQLVGHRFVLLEELGKGGMGVVHRALDRLTGDMVALKRVVPVQPNQTNFAFTPSKDELRLTLTREFKALAALRHPHIISVLDYGFDDDGLPYFAMELLTDARSLLEAGQDEPLDGQIRLLAHTFLALNYLHRYGILHRDLKPQNVQVVNGHVKVLDFGLAVLRDQSVNEDSSGTLAYMAPEVLLGASATEASDLYAMGVIAYELFAGRHPFESDNTSQMITAVINQRPELSDATLSLDVVDLLERLLEKEPDKRYSHVNDVLDVLARISSVPLPLETAAIRESFLQAARFVAREKEVAHLTAELDKALAGNGSAWLISGESGVGKSRLLDEMRVYALVKGFHVLRGQEVSAGGNPFQPWREVLRRLCLRVQLNNVQASILKPLIPDLATLIGRDIPDAPTLDAGAAQDRLFTTIEDVFKRNPFPTLVMLEDLHWADNATLVLLARLTRLTATQPLLILGSFRHDERPTLSDNVPMMRVQKLERFDDAGIEQLAASMLGEIGKKPEIVRLLNEESGGNPFFVVEVVRALAEATGRLDKIGTQPLPTKIFPGGVQDIINHRLNRVPADALPLLQLAAVMGRDIDLAVLRAAQPALDLDFWLAECADLTILEIEEAQWRFSQNKQRDGLLIRLSADELQAVHLQAAQAIEKAHPGGAGWNARLALHWEMAGDTARASDWYERAGYEAEAAYAPETAIGYYQKALAFLPDNDRTLARKIAINRGLGKMLRWQTRFDDAVEAYNTMQTAAASTGDTLAQAQAWNGLGEVQDRQGDRKTALAHAEQAETLARSLGAAGEVELADALGTKAWCLYRLKQRDDAVKAAEEARDIGTRLNILTAVARSESLLGVICAITGRLEEATLHMLKSLEMARAMSDKRETGIRLNNLAEVYKLRGQFKDAASAFDEALTIFHEIGYRDAELAALTNLGSVNITLENYPRAEQLLRDALALNQDEDWWGLSETHRCLAEVQLQQGLVSDALDMGRAALRDGTKAEIPEFIGRAWRVLGMALAHAPEPSLTLDDKTVISRDCFHASLEIFKQDGSEVEQAYTLRAWAAYEAEQGNKEQAFQYWMEAVQLFKNNQFDYEVQRTGQNPPL
jgi:tetratricopeptide (TPR) repeat protein